MSETPTIVWKIVDIVEESPTVRSLYLETSSTRPVFRAGQYLTVRLPDQNPREGKSYSISSAPHQDLIRLTVRKIGTFSSALHSKCVGDNIMTSPPYGFFHPEPEDTGSLIFIAGGIGIAPLYSIITDLIYRADTRPIRLFYSAQNEQELVFYESLSSAVATHKDAAMRTFVTRQKEVGDGHTARRLQVTDILEAVVDSADAQVFVCGSSQFTRDIWTSLREVGMLPEQIYTEGFF